MGLRLQFAGRASHQHHRVQGHLLAAVADPELAVGDGAGELHGALHHGRQGRVWLSEKFDDAQVVVQTELALVLLPPDAGATTAAVKVEHHLAGTVACLLEAALVQLAQLNQSSISSEWFLHQSSRVRRRQRAPW